LATHAPQQLGAVKNSNTMIVTGNSRPCSQQQAKQSIEDGANDVTGIRR